MFENNFKKQAAVEQDVTAIRDNLKFLLEYMPSLAKLYMEYFKALKNEGFTDEQAITLIGHHGTSLGVKGNQ